MKCVLTVMFIATLYAVSSQFMNEGEAHAASMANMPGPQSTRSSADFESKVTGESYKIKTFVPSSVPPKDGFPVLFILDGDRLFDTYADAIQDESLAGEIEPAVVVGIESGSGKAPADRTYDFTASDMTAHEKSIVVDLGPNPRFGGYDNFYRALTEEIKPAIKSRVHLDEHRSTLLGWSLGGLFVVHTMLVHPDAFNTYVALSPSLWRGGKQVFAELPLFKEKVYRSGLRPALFLGVGSLEETLAPNVLMPNSDRAKLTVELTYAHMVRNTRTLASSIRPLFRQQKARFKYQVFKGDSHNTVPWSSVNPILTFVLSPKFFTRD